jgi:putative ribosome biogenesis GTPase RsgA
MGLDRDFNPARMERLLALAMGSGAEPVIVLTKADLVVEPAAYVIRMQGLASEVPVVALSTITGMGLAEVRTRLGPGRTGVLIGSSGVGKSTLLNGDVALLHRCRRCGTIRSNRLAGDDDTDRIREMIQRLEEAARSG